MNRRSILISATLASVALLASLGTGCGMRPDPNVEYANPASYTSTVSAATAGSGPDAGYSCPTQPNVTPYYDAAFDGTGFYTACQSTQVAGDLRIHGRTETSATICAFPAVIVNGETLPTPIPDRQTGQPISKCGQATSTGIDIDFVNLKYTHVYIVEEQNQLQMSHCLQYLNFAWCPLFSYGKL